jgi:sirohydrochlorin cobaltochelatase
MTTVIVLAVHGAPPNDFPPGEMAEFFAMHAKLELQPDGLPEAARRRAAAVESHMREWPRTPANDPFHSASFELASHVAEVTGFPVVVGFNEFCAPSLDAALAEAASRRPARIVVVTPMLTAGGEHAERDIPAAIERARLAHAGTRIVYAWPYDPAVVSRFLASQVHAFAGDDRNAPSSADRA